MAKQPIPLVLRQALEIVNMTMEKSKAPTRRRKKGADLEISEELREMLLSIDPHKRYFIRDQQGIFMECPRCGRVDNWVGEFTYKHPFPTQFNCEHNRFKVDRCIRRRPTATLKISPAILAVEEAGENERISVVFEQ